MIRDKSHYTSIITTNTTTVIVDTDAYLYGLHISVVNQGTTWTLKVTNGDSPAAILVPFYTLYLEPDVGASVACRPPNPRRFEWLQIPKLMRGGIKVATLGGTPGEVHVWTDYQTVQGDLGS